MPQSRFCASFMLKNAKEKYFGEKNGEKRGKKIFGAHLKISSYKCSLRIYIDFTIIMSFNKTTAHLVRPHPFSTLCPTPLGKSPVWHLCYMLVLAICLEFAIPIFIEHTDSRVFHCHFSIFFLTIMEYLEQQIGDVYRLEVILMILL